MALNRFNKIYSFFLSDKKKKLFEKIIFFTAIAVFILYILALFLISIGLLPQDIYSTTIDTPNPISIIYTPFSIILIYEIYLLIYYLPKSITVYLGKQYEIVALILIRNIFEELASVSSEWGIFSVEKLPGLLYSSGGLLLLFLLIFSFYKLSGSKEKRHRKDEKGCNDKSNRRFVIIKKILAVFLVFVFIYLLGDIIYNIVTERSFTISDVMNAIKKLNNNFFNILFSAFIFVEVLILLFSFNISEGFHKVIRNSGFIISTILLKLSFWSNGTTSIIIMLFGVSFGVATTFIYRLFSEKL